jgi:hypothetical protein
MARRSGRSAERVRGEGVSGLGARPAQHSIRVLFTMGRWNCSASPNSPPDGGRSCCPDLSRCCLAFTSGSTFFGYATAGLHAKPARQRRTPNALGGNGTSGVSSDD